MSIREQLGIEVPVRFGDDTQVAGEAAPAGGTSGSRSALGRVAGMLLTALAFASVAAVLALALFATVPNLLGYHTYTIENDSMEPTLKRGDAALTRSTSAGSLQVGDLILRQDSGGGQPVFHRITNISEQDGRAIFLTVPAENGVPDASPVALSGNGDKVLYRVPYAGYALDFAGTWPGILTLIGVPLVLLSLPPAGRRIRQRTQRGTANEREAQAPTPPERSALKEPDVERLAGQVDDWALRVFVLRHSGAPTGMRQCEKHPPIHAMNTLEILSALRSETRLVATSQRVAEACAETGVRFSAAKPLRTSIGLAA